MNNTFFVIEDHSLTNLGIREILQDKTDFTCAGFAMDESDAFEKLTELDMKGALPKVLVLDLFLGKDSGIDVLREVNRHFPSIGVVVYSMYSNPGIVSVVLASGAKGFVSKAGSDMELVEAIKAVASGGTYIQKSLVEPLHMFKNIFLSLTKSEQSVLAKVIERKDIQQISEELSIPTHSIESYLLRIFGKTGCKNVDALIERFG